MNHQEKVFYLFKKNKPDLYNIIGKSKTNYIINGGEFVKKSGSQNFDIESIIAISSGAITIIDFVLRNYKDYKESDSLSLFRSLTIDKFVVEEKEEENKYVDLINSVFDDLEE